jgi:hypothetical protein
MLSLFRTEMYVDKMSFRSFRLLNAHVNFYPVSLGMVCIYMLNNAPGESSSGLRTKKYTNVTVKISDTIDGAWIVAPTKTTRSNKPDWDFVGSFGEISNY